MTTIPAITGSISSGTLRPQDLAPAFLSALEALAPHHSRLAGWREDVTYVVADEDPDTVTYYMRADETLLELGDAIDAALPEGYYFGANEGDGADYGIWGVEEF